MADLNTVAVAGRLTRDSELKYTAGGLAILRFSIAVNSRKRDAAGEWSDEANYFDITLFGKQGEALQSYLLKGRPVAVNGELRQDRWESEGQTRSRVYILANNIMLLGQGTSNGGEGAPMRSSAPNHTQPAKNSAPVEAGAPADDFEDDIPF
ncbi:MAG: single-stranded DNA-binding protein [Spirochaetia bacterium]